MARMIVCKECGRRRRLHGRGLCDRCYGNWYMREWRKENLERARATDRRRRERDADKIRVRKRAYYQRHREEICAYVRRWREAHPGYNEAYRKQNLKAFALNEARRRARKRLLPDTLTPEQAEQLLAVGHATYPGEKLHLDHIVPLSKGGGTTRANMHAIPASLNQSKRDRLPEEAYQQIGLEV